MSDNYLSRQIKRFDGTGFQGWKFQITAVLMPNEIFDVIDGTRLKPEAQTGDNAALMKTWVRDNAKAITSTEYVQRILWCSIVPRYRTWRSN